MMTEIERLRARAGGMPAGGALPPLVLESWQRCLGEYNLLPDVVPRPGLLTHRELRARLESEDDLVQVALPEIERLFERLADSDYLVSLASAEGVKLLFRCDPAFLGDMSRAGVLPGSIWAEEVQGTNGIGTCLKVGAPLSILGGEHFNRSVHALSCTVAPVFGAGGAVTAVVNVTAPRPVDPGMARMVRHIVESAALRIENRYFAHRNRRFRTLRISDDSGFADIAAEGRIAIDDAGRIVDISSPGPRLMGRGRQDIVGFALSDLLESRGDADEPCITREAEGGRAGRDLFTVPLARPALRDGRRAQASRGGVRGEHGAAAQAGPERLLMPPGFGEALEKAGRMLAAGVPVLIQGETGVGKTVFARLAAGAADAGGPGAGNVLSLNCAALTGEAEELDRLSGLRGATLVLDHVDEAPARAQMRLVQLLGEESFAERQGLRLVSIASGDLARHVLGGRMRADLHQRLKGAVIDLPALRNVPGLGPLVQAALAADGETLGKPGLDADDAARLVLLTYHWPGNLRELRRAARHAAVLARGGRAGIADLPQEIVAQVAHRNLSARSQSEASRIAAALRHNGGNVSETARYLGISRATLYRKIQIRAARGEAG